MPTSNAYRVTDLGRTCQLIYDVVTKNMASIWRFGVASWVAGGEAVEERNGLSRPLWRPMCGERSHLPCHENWPVSKTEESLRFSSLEGQRECLARAREVMAMGLEFCFIWPHLPKAKHIVNNSGWSHKALCKVIPLGNSSTLTRKGQGRTWVQMRRHPS